MIVNQFFDSGLTEAWSSNTPLFAHTFFALDTPSKIQQVWIRNNTDQEVTVNIKPDSLGVEGYDSDDLNDWLRVKKANSDSFISEIEFTIGANGVESYFVKLEISFEVLRSAAIGNVFPVTSLGLAVVIVESTGETTITLEGGTAFDTNGDYDGIVFNGGLRATAHTGPNLPSYTRWFNLSGANPYVINGFEVEGNAIDDPYVDGNVFVRLARANTLEALDSAGDILESALPEISSYSASYLQIRVTIPGGNRLTRINRISFRIQGRSFTTYHHNVYVNFEFVSDYPEGVIVANKVGVPLFVLNNRLESFSFSYERAGGNGSFDLSLRWDWDTKLKFGYDDLLLYVKDGVVRYRGLIDSTRHAFKLKESISISGAGLAFQLKNIQVIERFNSIGIRDILVYLLDKYLVGFLNPGIRYELSDIENIADTSQFDFQNETLFDAIDKVAAVAGANPSNRGGRGNDVIWGVDEEGYFYFKRKSQDFKFPFQVGRKVHFDDSRVSPDFNSVTFVGETNGNAFENYLPDGDVELSQGKTGVNTSENRRLRSLFFQNWRISDNIELEVTNDQDDVRYGNNAFRLHLGHSDVLDASTSLQSRPIPVLSGDNYRFSFYSKAFRDYDVDFAVAAVFVTLRDVEGPDGKVVRREIDTEVKNSDIFWFTLTSDLSKRVTTTFTAPSSDEDGDFEPGPGTNRFVGQDYSGAEEARDFFFDNNGSVLSEYDADENLYITLIYETKVAYQRRQNDEWRDITLYIEDLYLVLSFFVRRQYPGEYVVLDGMYLFNADAGLPDNYVRYDDGYRYEFDFYASDNVYRVKVLNETLIEDFGRMKETVRDDDALLNFEEAFRLGRHLLGSGANENRRCSLTLYDSDEFYPIYYDNEINWGYAQIFGSANVQTDYEYEIVSVRHTIKDEVLTSVLQLGSPFPTPSKLLRDLTARDRFRGDLARGSRQAIASVGGTTAAFGGVHITAVSTQMELDAIEIVGGGVNFAKVIDSFGTYLDKTVLIYRDSSWELLFESEDSLTNVVDVDSQVELDGIEIVEGTLNLALVTSAFGTNNVGDLLLYVNNAWKVIAGSGFGGTNVVDVDSQVELDGIEIVEDGLNLAFVTSAFGTNNVGDLLLYVDDVWKLIASKSVLRTGVETARLLEMLNGADRFSYSALKDVPTIPDEVTLTGEQVRDLLQALVDNERLQYSALSGTPTIPDEVTLTGEQVRDLLQALVDNERLQYSALSGTPTIPDEVTLTGEQVRDLLQALVDNERLQYSALSGTPTIPVLRDGDATYTLIQHLLDYNDLQNQPIIPTIPDLSAFLTQSQILALIPDNPIKRVRALPNIVDAEDRALYYVENNESKVTDVAFKSVGSTAFFDVTLGNLSNGWVGYAVSGYEDLDVDFSIESGGSSVYSEPDVIAERFFQVSGVYEPTGIYTRFWFVSFPDDSLHVSDNDDFLRLFVSGEPEIIYLYRDEGFVNAKVFLSQIDDPRSRSFVVGTTRQVALYNQDGETLYVTSDQGAYGYLDILEEFERD